MKNLYALKVAAPWAKQIHEDLCAGEGRFGWSYCKTADLRKLRDLIAAGRESQLSDAEWDCNQSFLLELQPVDYVVYINVPEWGRCTTARVTKEYYWQCDDEDFNHRIGVDPNSVFDFDRNDSAVHPNLSARLKLQGRWWRIYATEEFEDLLKAADSDRLGSRSTPEHRISLLADECKPHLRKITEAIHHTHPGKHLEDLIEDIIARIPGVYDVRHFRGRADQGADLVAVMESTHPITQEVNQTTCVIQVKSFEGEHWDTQAVEDIRKAFKAHPEATEGLIVSTATVSTEDLEAELERLRRELGRPVNLLIGEEVAALLLRSGRELITWQTERAG